MDIEKLKVDESLWPDGATHYVDDVFTKWVHGVEFDYYEDAKEWRKAGLQYSLDRYVEEPDHWNIIPRPQSDWVDGLPPVGCECEFSVHTFGERTEFQRCEFLARNEVHGVSWVKTDDDFEVVYDSDQPVFRPIPTKAQRDRDELKQIIADSEKYGHDYIADNVIAAGWTKP